MRVHVAFTPDEAAGAPTGVVIDVIRATSTICQALDAGYERVWCAAEVDDARALRGPGVTLGGERLGVRIDGFDLGNSPREYLEPRTPTLAISTTNGTRAIVTAAARCERVLIASLLNLAAVTEAAAAHGEDVAVFCAGVKGAFALDDAYVAGRIVDGLGPGQGQGTRGVQGVQGVALASPSFVPPRGARLKPRPGKPRPTRRSDAAEAAVRLARSYATAEEAFRASRSGRDLIEHGPELEADIPWCARESVLDVVPRLVGLQGAAAELDIVSRP
ncbi:2-phosphosulfolactate phosphatase [Gaiella sp.]|uniref:2-phosphosulfolactate phosphatase n=1 Tax=Gaiella sp. TaxID=2663207 RepID=UPI002E3032A6|nr:2-phosphosulfolactate phosphatase [Gaiella sp.]HEX5583313.1 2-phosphosulfolactate phosphatase [Gaiella sp.]